MRRALILTVLFACGPQPGDDSTAGDTSGGTTSAPTTGAPTTGEPTTAASTSGTSEPAPTGSSGDATTDPTTGELVEPCTCDASDEDVCTGMLNDCAAPAPCDLVDETNPEATDCVLAQMLAPTFFQFRYCHMCGGFESYDGTFVVLGPEGGVDMLCHAIDFSQDLEVRAHTSQPASYFADCQALANFKERRTCLLNGFKPGDLLPKCE